jgi:hypothetical protein
MTKKPLCRSQLPILALPLKLLQIIYDPYEDASLYGDGGYAARVLWLYNWVGNNTQEASNADPNNRYDFDHVVLLMRFPETIGALPGVD